MLIHADMRATVNGMSIEKLREFIKLADERIRFAENYQIPREALELLHAGKKIEAIKVIQEQSGLSPVDAKIIVDHAGEKAMSFDKTGIASHIMGIPVYDCILDGKCYFKYVRISDIPSEGCRKDFKSFLYGKTCPVIEALDKQDAVYYDDFRSFVFAYLKERSPAEAGKEKQ